MLKAIRMYAIMMFLKIGFTKLMVMVPLHDRTVWCH